MMRGLSLIATETVSSTTVANCSETIGIRKTVFRLWLSTTDRQWAATLTERSRAEIQFPLVCGFGKTLTTTEYPSRMNYIRWLRWASVLYRSITKTQGSAINTETCFATGRKSTAPDMQMLGVGRLMCFS